MSSSSSLLVALRRGASLREIRPIVERCPQQISVRDKATGWIPLHVAVAQGACRQVLRHLVNAWRDSVRQEDYEGCIPLHYVGPESCLRSVRYLVRRWPESVEAPNDAGQLPLHAAAGWRARLPVLRFLVNRHPQALAVPDFAGNPPLHCLFGPDAGLNHVRLFVERGGPRRAHQANVPHGGDLVLHAAVRHKCPLPVVRYLAHLRPGSVRARDAAGRCPLFHHFDVVDGELEYGSDNVLRYLLAQWPDWVHERDANGNTVLHHAVIMGMARLEAVQLLLRLWPGALRVTNHQGSIPLRCALDREEPIPEILECLVESWPDSVREIDSQGRRPIHVALDRDDPSYEAVGVLLQHDPGVGRQTQRPRPAPAPHCRRAGPFVGDGAPARRGLAPVGARRGRPRSEPARAGGHGGQPRRRCCNAGRSVLPCRTAGRAGDAVKTVTTQGLPAVLHGTHTLFCSLRDEALLLRGSAESTTGSDSRRSQQPSFFLPFFHGGQARPSQLRSYYRLPSFNCREEWLSEVNYLRKTSHGSRAARGMAVLGLIFCPHDASPWQKWSSTKGCNAKIVANDDVLARDKIVLASQPS
jgi:ankyrin repeat protein